MNEFDYKVKYWNPKGNYLAIESEIDLAVKEVLKSGEYILGPAVEEFEKSLASYVGTKYAVGVNSGTDALKIALRAAGIKEGDEVITVSHTFIATIEAIEDYCRAKAVLVDIDENWLMDVEDVKRKITPKTKAIIPVHLSGDVCNMTELQKIADEHNLIIIEDAAQGMGATWEGKRAGSFGTAGCFSFFPAKIFGSYGDAGAITTNDTNLYEKFKMLRNHYYIGKSLGIEQETVQYGINSRLNTICAAILNVKLKYIDKYLGHRKWAADLYTEGFKDLPIILPSQRQGRVWQDYIIRVPERRNELAKFLDDNGIKVRGHDLIPNHFYKGLGLSADLPKTEGYTFEFLRLPLSSEIEEWEIKEVISTIRKFYEKSSL